jgi:hypothetical protein
LESRQQEEADAEGKKKTKKKVRKPKQREVAPGPAVKAFEFKAQVRNLLGPSIVKELQQLVGMTAVKESIQRMVLGVWFDMARGATPSGFGHFVFRGDPGTGKSLIADLMARILQQMQRALDAPNQSFEIDEKGEVREILVQLESAVAAVVSNPQSRKQDALQEILKDAGRLFEKALERPKTKKGDQKKDPNPSSAGPETLVSKSDKSKLQELIKDKPKLPADPVKAFSALSTILLDNPPPGGWPLEAKEAPGPSGIPKKLGPNSADSFKKGDDVFIRKVTKAAAEKAQNGSGGFNSNMKKCLGKPAVVREVIDEDKIRCFHESQDTTWVWSPELLVKKSEVERQKKSPPQEAVSFRGDGIPIATLERRLERFDEEVKTCNV